jgi:diamine N-acetyltransferase
MDEESETSSPVPFLRGTNISLYSLNLLHKSLDYQWNNAANVRLYFGNSFPLTMTEIDRWFTESSTNKIQFEVWHNIDQKPIGLVIISNIHWIRRKCTIGALIGPKEYRGHGYGREITQLLIDYIFGELNLHKIAVIIYSPNIASQKVVESLEFTLEAHIKDAGYFDGKYCEDLYYAMFQNEWRLRRGFTTS